MKVSRTEIISVLDAVIDGRLQRETVEEWAQRWIDALDAGALVFVPAESESHLWEALSALQTLAAKAESGAFVHSRRDLLDLRERAAH